MSDFYHPHQDRVARKEHRCTYCGEAINARDEYVYQTGVYDGAWYVSKMHPECFEDLGRYEEGEYTPYSNERPEREQQT